jgi:hypothetical protein
LDYNIHQVLLTKNYRHLIQRQIPIIRYDENRDEYKSKFPQELHFLDQTLYFEYFNIMNFKTTGYASFLQEQIENLNIVTPELEQFFFLSSD